MSSRRIAISSLLNDGVSPSESLESPPMSATSSLGLSRLQERPFVPHSDPTTVPAPQPTPARRSKISSLMNPVTTDPIFDAHQHQNQRPEIWEKRSVVSTTYRHIPGQSPVEAPWPSPLSTSAAPSSYPHQTLSTHHRTPSPSTFSPTHDTFAGRDFTRSSRRVDVSSGLPRDSVGYANQPHPHQGFHLPLPPPPSLSSPTETRESERGRTASQLLVPHTLPQVPRPRPSPISPRSFPSAPQPLLHSPSRPSPSSTTFRQPPVTMMESEFYRSPKLSRSPEVAMRPPLLSSTSQSPSVPKSPLPDGLSGLDVLVQAATEERERIDVNRKHSGPADGAQSGTSVGRKAGSLSPAAFRGHQALQSTPLTPPLTASSQGLDGISAGGMEIAREFGGERGLKRRRESNEGPPLTGHRLSQSFHDYSGSLSSTQVGPAEHRDPPIGEAFLTPKFEPYPTAMQHQRRGTPEHSPNPALSTLPPTSTGSSAIPMQSASPVSPVLLEPVQSRRSPPRSKPKPRKPGSAALANLERERREFEPSVPSVKPDVSLISNSIHTAEGNIITRSPELLQPVPLKVPTKNKLLQPMGSVSQKAVDDTEVDDFFQSTFDSPRPAPKEAPTAKQSGLPTIATHHAHLASMSHPMHEPVVGGRYSQPAVSAVRDRMSSPANQDEASEYEFMRSAIDEDGPVSDADLLDEIADVAGATATDDEQGTSNMEVDVENELLELVNDSEALPASSTPTTDSLHHEDSHLSQIRTADEDEEKVPTLTDQPTSSSAAKPKKKRSKLKKPADEASDISEELLDAVKSQQAASNPLLEVPSDNKSSKTKAKASKKDSSGDKSKATKSKLKGSVAAIPPVVDDDFPLVTSSGRLITKSKKSVTGFSTITDSYSQTTPSQTKKKGSSLATSVTTAKDVASRSRSVSVVARDSVEPEAARRATEDKKRQREATAEEEAYDDARYCVCKTIYDEGSPMLGCDRCDDWFHPACIGFKELDIELIDDFECPTCLARDPTMKLSTTYKPRCFAGLMHPDSDSADACHKPARGALLSKYCSDECGARYMHRKIGAWQANGGNVERLWENVKNAKPLLGCVKREPDRPLPRFAAAEIKERTSISPSGDTIKATDIPPSDRDAARVADLEAKLPDITQEREEMKAVIRFNTWQAELFKKAIERREKRKGDELEECGWDHRLLFSLEEWREHGAGTLESYDESQNENVPDEEVWWWCRGDFAKCGRHAGWHKMPQKMTVNSGSSASLLARERSIRSQIEDILHPVDDSKLNFRSLHSSNRHHHHTDSGPKKGKKRAALAAI